MNAYTDVPIGAGSPDVWLDGPEPSQDDNRNDGPAFRPFRTITLSDVTPERVEWLWPGRIPRAKLTVLDGDPGVGKSTLAIDIAAHITTGTSWPDGTPCPTGHVIMLSGEDGLSDTVRPRLDSAGADPQRFHVLDASVHRGDDGQHIERDPHLGDVATIEAAILHHGAVLLIVDVLMGFLPSGVDSHRDQDIRVVLRRLRDLAEATGCSVLLLRHLNKAPGGSALYRGGGSIGIVGAARSGLLAGRDPDDPELIVVAVVKSNLAREAPSLAYRLVDDDGTGMVVWEDGPVDRRAGDLLHIDQGDDDRDERDALAGFIVAYLTDQGGTAPAREVTSAINKAFGQVGKNVLTRVRKRAGVTTGKGGMSTGWLWSLPEDPAEDPEGPASREPGIFGTFAGSSGDREPSGHHHDQGACTICAAPCHRYGDGGSPLCEACRAARVNG